MSCSRQAADFSGPVILGEGLFVSTDQEMADKQLDQLQLKLASSRSPISRPRILYNRLWRFPFKPPALLGVIGSPAKPPALPERIEAVLQLREWGHKVIRSPWDDREAPQGDRDVTGS